jgi:LCP family protein required for cell wall assembly
VLIGFLIVANVGIFGGLAAVWLAARQVTGAISTVPADELDLADTPGDLGEPRTFLLIGSDSREGVPEDFTNLGNFPGQRADVIILLTLRPDDDRVQMISLPRDLRIVQDDRAMRINATFNEGPGEILDAVTEFAGIPIHHYLQVNFEGFARIVDEVGGIEMTFPHQARDRKSGFDVGAGKQTLDGKQALALARSRSYQEFIDGRWVYIDASDIGRTARQRDLLMAIFTQIEVPTSLGAFGSLVEAVGQFVITDDAFDESDIIQLGWEMRNISTADIDSITLPVQIFEESGVSYVIPVEPEATQALAAFRDGEPFSDTVVGAAAIQVENGNGREGAAGQIAEVLEAVGYQIVGTGNSGREDYSVTQVVARPSALPLAEAVVAYLGYGEAVVGSTPSGVDVVVIVGLDAPAS